MIEYPWDVIFQSTLPRRERQLCNRPFHLCVHDFNPRSREGSDGDIHTISHLLSHFNPRSREGSDRALCLKTAMRLTFQSTLPRRERHDVYKRLFRILISIHAPAKGATRYPVPLQPPLPISIHAPAKGATAFINIFSLTVRLFLFHLTNKI